jgi:hypothetical protein
MKKRLDPPTVHSLQSNHQEQGGIVMDIVYDAARVPERKRVAWLRARLLASRYLR